MLHAVGDALAEPVFWRFTVQTTGDTLPQVTLTAVTCAEFVNDPKRPKTKPATAMAAMRVIAMRMTVARTGEMAFLFFPCCTIFIVELHFPSFLIKPCGV
jgi:hypothetical protein